jgi:hypothetical protein
MNGSGWRLASGRWRQGAVLVAVLAMADRAPIGAQSDPVRRLGEYVEDYYARAQSIVTEETVVVQPLAMDLTGAGFPRRAVYELRVEWDPAAATAEDRAVAVRQLIKATGPALFDPGEEACGDPPSITPEPLAFLLPANQPEWNFVIGKPARIDGRSTMTVEYTKRDSQPPRVISDKDCLFTDLSGQTAGRLWADPSTAEILRMDERLLGMVDVKIPKNMQKKGKPTEVTYERMNSSVRYKRVAFTEPDEEVLLPASIETLQIHRSNNGVSRLRITQTFAKYRRFVTSSRLVTTQ